MTPEPSPRPASGSPPGPVDVIGDVHGHLGALRRVGGLLGYRTDDGWSHPDGRQLLFLGDLVDRGPASLDVAEEVMRLVAAGRGLCLMGNHEYNLVSTALGLCDARPSNADTVTDLALRPARWQPVLSWLATLPLALELPGLRAVHAVWHNRCAEALGPLLGSAPIRAAAAGTAALGPWVTLGSPFSAGALREGLPSRGLPPGDDLPHEVLIKGFEEEAEVPFLDADDKWRKQQRVCWWLGQRDDIPADGRVVFGHYWCLPPRLGAELFAPPYPTGHPDNASWLHRHVQDLAAEGRWPVPAHERFVCVDYNGTFMHHAVGCVGAYRWPEHEVVWASEPS